MPQPQKQRAPSDDRKKPPRVLLSDFKAKKEQEGSIEIETDDGEVFVILPPQLWPDAVLESADTDPVRAAKALLGDRYEAFVAAGGSAAIIMSITTEQLGVNLGVSLGE